MIDKKIMDFYIDRKRRFAKTQEEFVKIDAISELVKYSDWIDSISKETYINIMQFLGFNDKEINDMYNDYMQMKSSFLDKYTNIYPFK